MSGDDREERPDIELRSGARARELRFHEKPDAAVKFRGSRGRRSVSRSERRNLPCSVDSGVAYHDVEIDHTLLTALTGTPDESGRSVETHSCETYGDDAATGARGEGHTDEPPPRHT